MTRHALLAATLACLAVTLPPPAAAQAAASAVESPVPSLAPMIKRVSPAVVNIAIRGTIRERGGQRNPLLDDPFFRRFFDVPPEQGPRERQFQSAGSGVIVDAKAGYIVTNAHVVENASEITVTLQDGRDLAAEVVGTDERTDVAVVKVKGDSLTQIALGNSDRMEVGDYVVAIGNPFGLQHTVTSGIVSGLGRSGINPDGYENFIQTDASINPGNSGGALVDVSGNLMGINTAIYSRSGGSMGIGFAIPVSTAKLVLDGIVRDGQVTRGWIGVEPGELSPELAQTFGVQATRGVIITGVLQGAPAAQGGIRPGDVILSVAGKPTDNVSQLLTAVAGLQPGKAASFELQRGDRQLELSVVPGTRPRMQQRR